MKRLFNFFGFLCLGLASCTGCTKRDNTPVLVAPSVVLNYDAGSDAGPDASLTTPEPLDLPDQKLHGVGWELTVPAGWETLQDDEVKPEVYMGNVDEHNLILLTKEEYVGDTARYALDAIKAFREDGTTVSSSTQVELNGRKFVVLETINGEARMWFWLATQNGVGYALSCGGPADEDHHKELCNDVAKTFKIK